MDPSTTNQAKQMVIAALIILLDYPQKDVLDKPLYDYEKIIFDHIVAQGGNTNFYIKHLG